MLLAQQFDPKNYQNAETISEGTRVLVTFGPHIEELFHGLVTAATNEEFAVELDDAEYQGASIYHFQQADNCVYIDAESTRQWAALTALREHNGVTFAIDLMPGAVSINPGIIGCPYISWWIQYSMGRGSAGTSPDRRTAIMDMYEVARSQGYMSERSLSGTFTIAHRAETRSISISQGDLHLPMHGQLSTPP